MTRPLIHDWHTVTAADRRDTIALGIAVTIMIVLTLVLLIGALGMGE